MTAPPRRIAAPSWVMPASIEENCRYLAGRVHEVGLLFFATRDSLAYGKDDLPESLALLPLSFHVHLPLDLPWSEPERTAGICLDLLARTAHLVQTAHLAGPGPHCRAVLHPPPHEPSQPLEAGRRLERFARRLIRLGGDPSLFLLENTRENDLADLARAAAEAGFAFCLDSGHMLAYAQEDLLDNSLILERAAMLHLSAPGPDGKDGHQALTALSAPQEALCRRLIRETPARAVLMLEVFSARDLENSLPVLRSWLLPD